MIPCVCYCARVLVMRSQQNRAVCQIVALQLELQTRDTPISLARSRPLLIAQTARLRTNQAWRFCLDRLVSASNASSRSASSTSVKRSKSRTCQYANKCMKHVVLAMAAPQTAKQRRCHGSAIVLDDRSTSHRIEPAVALREMLTIRKSQIANRCFHVQRTL